jgi:oligopeptidase A
MATLPKAEELLEQLRGASYDAAQRDLDDIRAHAAEHGFDGELKQVCG